MLFISVSFADVADLICYERNSLDPAGAPLTIIETFKEVKSNLSFSTYPLVGKYKEFTDENGKKEKVFLMQNPDYDDMIKECSKRIKPAGQIFGVGAYGAKANSSIKAKTLIVDNLSIMDFLKKNKLIATLKSADLLAGLVDTEKNFKQFLADYHRDFKDVKVQFGNQPALILSNLIPDSVIAEKNVNLVYLSLKHNLQLMEPLLTEKEASIIAEFILRYNNQSSFMSLPTLITGGTLAINAFFTPIERSLTYQFAPSKDHQHIHLTIKVSTLFPGYFSRDQEKDPFTTNYKFTYSIPLVLYLSKYQLPDQMDPRLDETAQMLTIVAIPTLFDSFQLDQPHDALISNYVKHAWLDLRHEEHWNKDSWSIVDSGK